MSEKFDGVRGYWNGDLLYSRHGKEIACPKWYTQQLPPNITLDGELWMGHGSLELLNAALHLKENSVSWNSIHFMVFDMPSSNEPYEIRVREMAKLQLPSHVCVVEPERCNGIQHLNQYLAKLLGLGSEGLMLNQPGSLYVASRTSTLLKVKVGFCDRK
jgi:DNA ligase-1